MLRLDYKNAFLCGIYRKIMCRSHNSILSILERLFPRLKERQCPCCGWIGFRFRSFAVLEYLRLDVICPSCGSFERHRALWYYYRHFFTIEKRKPKYLIHFAAEECLKTTLQSICDYYVRSNYRYHKRCEVRLDLITLGLRDESCDCLLMNHVLDCMPDDFEAIREMDRVLKPGGAILATVSFKKDDVTRECPVASNSRYRVYGSRDFSKRFMPFAAQFKNVSLEIAEQDRKKAAIPSFLPILFLKKAEGKK